MRFIVMFITAVCVLFLIKLRWPKKKNFYHTYKILIIFKSKFNPQRYKVTHTTAVEGEGGRRGWTPSLFGFRSVKAEQNKLSLIK